ncbi:hypothetical protein V6N13_097582 [Hibiscus sabdariffa]
MCKAASSDAWHVHIIRNRLHSLNTENNKPQQPFTCFDSYETAISSKYADGSDDEFYCDACEEKRYKFESVYYCVECKFMAEVCCVIPELLASLSISEEQSGTNGRGISRDEETQVEANIEKVNVEMAEKRPLEVDIEERVPPEEKLELINLKLKNPKSYIPNFKI